MSSQTPSAAITQYEQALAQMQQLAEQYKQQLAAIMNMPAAARLWEFQLTCFPLLLQFNQIQIVQNSDVQNIATDLRNLVTNAQNAFNNITSIVQELSSAGAHLSPTAEAQAQSYARVFSAAMSELNTFLDTPGVTAMIGTANVQNLEGFCSDVWSNFPQTAATTPSGIVNAIQSWFVGQAGSSAAVGTASTPQIQDITNQFQNLNQTLSSTSSQAQTEMQYMMQNLQQFLGVYKSNFDTFNQLSLYYIQNAQVSTNS